MPPGLPLSEVRSEGRPSRSPIQQALIYLRCISRNPPGSGGFLFLFLRPSDRASGATELKSRKKYKMGPPPKPSASGFGGERRSKEAQRIFAAGGNKRSGLCYDEGPPVALPSSASADLSAMHFENTTPFGWCSFLSSPPFCDHITEKFSLFVYTAIT